MSHNEHGNEKHEPHWHEEESQVHWPTQEHYNDHDWYEHENEEYEYEHENEEFEEKEFQKVSDLLKISSKDLKDLDMGQIHIVSILQPFKKLFKQNTLDIIKNKWKNIELSLHPKIKIIALQRPIGDLVPTKKRSDIHINDYCPDKDKHTLNMINIEYTYLESGPYSDIIKPKIKFKKRCKNFLNLLKLYIIKWKKFYSYWFLFIILCFFYGLFIKYEIENTLQNVKNITFTTDKEKFKTDIFEIKSWFILSDFLLRPIFYINSFFYNPTLNNLENILIGWNKFTDYMLQLILVYDGIDTLIKEKWLSEIMYSELLKNIDPILLQAKNDINKSVTFFRKIKNLTNSQKIDFWEKMKFIEQIQKYTNIFYNNTQTIKNMLWDEQKRTYMIVFQNADEIRPTGWFMGSAGFIEIYKWKILKFEKKDMYAVEWWLQDFFWEASPDWLSSITDRFTLRDANFYPDIAQSSNKIKSFLEKTQYKIDGIIYMNQNIILDFLKNFGGVYFDKVQREITNENFSMLISTLVESKVTRTYTLATPKQILFDFIDVYIKELQKIWKYHLYIKNIFESIEKKDIILYSFSEKENSLFTEFWFNKKIDESKYMDFNFPVFTSISWNKSDRYIQRSFTKEVKKNADCSIQTHFQINVTHSFNSREEWNIKKFLADMNLDSIVDVENTLITQWKWINKQYMRILVPKNAIFEKNPQIAIKDIKDKKEISFYMDTSIWTPSEFNINYTLPNPSCRPYNYVFEKEPWIKEYKLNIIIDGNLILDSYLQKDYYLK